MHNLLKIAFHRDIRSPSVTLEGDIFQPSGLLTGGSRKGGGELLRWLHALSNAETELAIHQNKLARIEAEVHPYF
ncbi:structural maintenance of chromosomes protein 2-2 [Cryptomeria japonica]|uniref:structural maintenance of chromosomes protein 2-2 n=1 Tax=Cryptomeria japonica TaxID=3369 RepID=UPI0027D9FC33|nr:structural maintenance of chromosomes protein 2-2 [Cryptomeria japonica]